MRKIILYAVFITLGIIALSLLIPMLGIAISTLLIIGGVHLYTDRTSVGMKILSLALILIGITSALSNIPGFIGLIVVGAIYYLYKKNRGTAPVSQKDEDPFTNFEKEWANITK